MSIRKHLLNLFLFLQREFVSNSKEYFEKRFFQAYNIISFKKDELVYTNEFDIKLKSFINQYPFMHDFLSYRNKAKSLEDYCNICFNVINEHFIQVKKDNTLYSNDLLQNKDETVAYNIVKHQRNDFFNKIKTIFFLIEKKYSIEYNIEKTNRESTSKKQVKESIKGISNIKFSLKENYQVYSKEFYSDNCYALIAFKLHELEIINLNIRGIKKKIHNELEEIFNKKFSYDNFCGTTKELTEGIELIHEQKKFIQKLNFLNKLEIK